MRLTEPFEFLLGLYKQVGAQETGKYLLARTIKRGRTRVILIALSDPSPIPKAVEASKDHEFRFATVDEILELQKDPEKDINDTNVDQLRRGMTRCLLLMEGVASRLAPEFNTMEELQPLVRQCAVKVNRGVKHRSLHNHHCDQ